MFASNGQRWLNRNSFDLNYDYTLKVLRRFNIENYHFVNDGYGNSALIIEKNLKKYKLEIYQREYYDKDLERNEIESCMVIKRCEVHRNGQKHSKEYMVEKKRIYEDCIYLSVKWTSNNSRL